MIEVIDTERCTKCNICVRVCPTDVFERVPGGPPRIARQDSCQTCFMCEIHCPDDAMYVAPLREPAPPDSIHLDVSLLKSQGYLGSFRHRLGWGDGRQPPNSLETLAALAADGPRTLEQPDSAVKPRVVA